MKELTVEQLNDNVFETIGKEWMIVTAGTINKYNNMTASWGGLGWLWNKPVAFIFIRPERHTIGFIEEANSLTLSFLGNSKQARDIYNLLGSKSGRDIDKMHIEGLSPIATENNSVAYAEARLTLNCRKLFVTDMNESNFIDKSLVDRWYGPNNRYHRIYVVEIEKITAND